MKATIEFDLPDDEIQLKLAIGAGEMFSTLWGIDQYLRNHLKHDGQSTADELAEYIRGEIGEILTKYESWAIPLEQMQS